MQKKYKLWTKAGRAELEQLPLLPYAAQRRKRLLEALDGLEAGQTVVRIDPQLKRFYRRLAARKNRSVAKVAVARKLATRLYLMLREDWTYAQLSQAVMQVGPSHSVAGKQEPSV